MKDLNPLDIIIVHDLTPKQIEELRQHTYMGSSEKSVSVYAKDFGMILEMVGWTSSCLIPYVKTLYGKNYNAFKRECQGFKGHHKHK